MTIPRFGSLMDAVIWVAERDRPCVGIDCDLDAPCKRLWLRQLAKGVKP